MQKISLTLNLVLLIAVIFLFVKVFSGNSPDENTEVKQPEPKQVPNGAKVAFVNSDSLNNGYVYLKVKNEEFAAEEKKARETLTQQQKYMMTRQGQIEKNYSLLTPAEQQQAQMELMQLQDKYVKTEEKLMGELQNKQVKVMSELYSNVGNFLKEYCTENKIDYVFSYVQGAQLLYASDQYDITQDVLKGINDSYEKGRNEALGKTN